MLRQCDRFNLPFLQADLCSAAAVNENQCDQIWRNFATLATFKSLWAMYWIVYLVFDKRLYLLWHFYATWQIVIVVPKWRKVEQ